MYDKGDLLEKIRELDLAGSYVSGADMACHTSIRAGGRADALILPESISEIVKVAVLCKKKRFPLLVIGNGTNILARDGGVRGAVMKLGGRLNGLRREGDRIVAGAGALLADAARFAAGQGLSGLEFARGIPGSVGGAVCMNAGAYGTEMKDAVYRTVYLDADGSVCLIDNIGHCFEHRGSWFQGQKCIILETEFRLAHGDPKQIEQKMAELGRLRAESQPLDMPSAGSAFKRPPGGHAAPMIEACGLKGYSIGGAAVSEKHAGFIVNTGGATAGDIVQLISHIKKCVRRKFGVSLQTEIRIVGENAEMPRRGMAGRSAGNGAEV
ncbi:MAG: UDP-N-acetylmuramate dehydrogenase [Clostridiales bacterium]|jgi:UDP-N-acetylmuramate dehydrogenase|nr:UDP-N-acetylmuramate dehydrogenase [Clostridiales bacterium]